MKTKKVFQKCVFGGVLTGIILLAVSCTTFKAEGLTFMPQSAGMQNLGHFHEGKTVIELFGSSGGTNLFNITASAMKDKIPGIIWNEINKMGGNAAVNVKITYYVGPVAYFFNAITFHLIAPARIVIEGDVVFMDNVPAGVAANATNQVIQNAISVASSNGNSQPQAPVSYQNSGTKSIDLSGYALWGDDHGSYNSGNYYVNWTGAWTGGGIYGLYIDISGYKYLELSYTNASGDFQVTANYADESQSPTVTATARGSKVSVPLDSSKGQIVGINIQNKEKNSNSVQFVDLRLTNSK